METAEILKCEDIGTLYLEKVALTDKIGALHRNVALNKGQVDEADYKAPLTTAYAVMEALNHRLHELEDFHAQTKDEEGRIRYNFMRIAKVVLTKETYEKIRGMSQNPLKDMKPMFKQLRKEKLE
jgi:hypothetical protein